MLTSAPLLKLYRSVMSEPVTGDKVSNLGTGTPTTPFAILRAATQAVPAVKWALGVAGVISATALVKVFFVSVGAALLAGFGMLVLMVILVLFAAATRAKSSVLIVPAMVLTWALLVLVIFSSVFTVSAAFFGWPKPLQELIKGITSGQSIETPQTPTRGIKLANAKDVLSVDAKPVVEHQQPIILVWDGLAEEKEAWVAVYSEDSQTYFPQSCIKTATSARELPCTIEIGKANDSGTFLVLVIEAGDGAQRELSRYIGQLDRSGMRHLPNGANIGYTTTVLRR
jgi:hypothetical protein